MNLWARELRSKSKLGKLASCMQGSTPIPAFLTTADNNHTWGLLLSIPVQSPRNKSYFLLDRSVSTIQRNTNVQRYYDFCPNSRSNPLFASDFLPTEAMCIFNLYLCIFFCLNWHKWSWNDKRVTTDQREEDWQWDLETTCIIQEPV